MSPRPDPRRSQSSARPPRSGAPKKTQPSLGGEQVEGRRAVRELLVAGRRLVRDLWVSDSVEEGPAVAEILDLARDARVPVRRVPRARLDAEARTDAPQGVLAHAQPLPEVELETLCRGRAFLIVLDGVTDPQNFGALLRTASVAGATGAVVARHRAVHVTPSAAKAAAGAIEHVPIAVVSGIPAALATMAAAGVWTVGLEPEAPTPIWGLELATEPLALVLGSEGAGLSRLVRARCEALVGIPQRGPLGSLNVSAAGAIACFEVARRRSATADS
jgi:23S rRNA (guanosine2251-2'-O)-methyltransferase